MVAARGVLIAAGLSATAGLCAAIAPRAETQIGAAAALLDREHGVHHPIPTPSRTY